MKLLALPLIVALVLTLVTGQEPDFLRHYERELDSVDEAVTLFCGTCAVCKNIPKQCTSNTFRDLACNNCQKLEGYGGLRLCKACDLCYNATTNNQCDTQQIVDITCGFCDQCGNGGCGDDKGKDDVTVICFSEVATVQVQGKGATTMKELQVGDRVLTEEGTYESVYAFGHWEPNQEAKFLQIFSDNLDKPLEVTGDHLVFVEGHANPVPAKSIQVGDVLPGLVEHSKSTVTKIGTVERKGVYAPLTTGGSLLVDGVKASSYIHLPKNDVLPDHGLIHVTLSPYRLLCQGVSSRFCENSFHHEESGMPYYVHYGLQLLNFIFELSFVPKMVGLFLVCLLAGLFQVLETLLGSPLSVVLMGAAGTMVYHKTLNGVKKVKTI